MNPIKYTEDIAVSGDKIRTVLGFKPEYGLASVGLRPSKKCVEMVICDTFTHFRSKLLWVNYKKFSKSGVGAGQPPFWLKAVLGKNRKIIWHGLRGWARVMRDQSNYKRHWGTLFTYKLSIRKLMDIGNIRDQIRRKKYR